MAKKTAEARWRSILTERHDSPLSWLPHAPRCAICSVPFEGIGGAVGRAIGYRRCNQNPTMCNQCYTHMPDGGLEMDVAVMYPDLERRVLHLRGREEPMTVRTLNAGVAPLQSDINTGS